jgi:hypothetical protein
MVGVAGAPDAGRRRGSGVEDSVGGDDGAVPVEAPFRHTPGAVLVVAAAIALLEPVRPVLTGGDGAVGAAG